MRMTNKPKGGLLSTTTLIPLEVTITRPSRNPNTKYQTIMFWDCDNKRPVKTHVVSSYGNYTRWKKILNYWKQNNKEFTAILQSDNFKFKDIDVIDADSTFVMHSGVTWDDVEKIIGVNYYEDS